MKLKLFNLFFDLIFVAPIVAAFWVTLGLVSLENRVNRVRR